MRRSQHIIAVVGIAAIATALVSFSGGDTTQKNDDDKKKKYHVIHQKDGELVEYDTIIPMSSEYSVQDFLVDKGIDDPEAKIIKVPSMANGAFISDDGEDTRIFVHKMDEEIETTNENGVQKEVKIIREENENGEVVTKKYVNGEEVELSEEDMKRIHQHKEGAPHKVIIRKGDDDLKWEEKEHSENVELKVKMDDEGNMHVQKFVNGEEVEVSEEEMEQIKNREHRQHKVFIMKSDDDKKMTPKEGEEIVALKVEMDDEGNMKVQKFVNGEEVEVSEKEMEEIKAGQDERILLIHGDHKGDIKLDSLMEVIEMDVEMIEGADHEEGQQRIIVKEIRMDDVETTDDMKVVRKEIRMRNDVEVNGEEEDFTVVLVHENYNESMEEQTHIRMIVEDDDEVISDEREMSLNDPISVYPNPNDGSFTIAFTQKNTAKTSINVVDAQGKVVFKEKLGDFSGAYKKELDLKKHGVGVYIVTVQQGGETSSRKVIVE
ncbi:MAG: T9SS type A sorting domain-containing protein [bacterium]|nr:T9SS type A sorting domain-containing protein [bacterium]